jgi:hypothetical protein
MVLEELTKGLDLSHLLQGVKGKVIGPPAYFMTILADKRFSGQTSELEGIEVDGAYSFTRKGYTGKLVRAEEAFPNALEANSQDAINPLCLQHRLHPLRERILEIICWLCQMKGTDFIFIGAA